ncbi:D-2-hydroxyacid dehydrogenase [Salipaludibacillus sp. HK11]|uniref:D-2-hydroxyacid dehydrogenase n=1 Tax=Salipaludibacillus sp. HK11 TaxID=3394320 RepID=UPI0039FCC105
MKKRKLIITQNLDDHLIEKIHNVVPDWEVIIGQDQNIWEEHLHSAEVIAGWKKQIKEACKSNDTSIRWVQAWSAGVNSLPLGLLKDRNISVTSANGVHAYPISKTIFALILGLTRNIHTYVKNQQAKTWHHANLKLEIHQKTIGIIGVGAIGKETAKIAKAFGMEVLGVRNSGIPSEYVDNMYSSDQLNEILPLCDFVVVTLPLTKDTTYLFGRDQFKQMKNTGVFINIGRGQIVVENELIDALQIGEIAGAGLDVFETEPLQPDTPLWNMDNVIVTPHTAGATEHYDKRVIEDIFIPNFKKYVQDKPMPVNLLDFNKGY